MGKNGGIRAMKENMKVTVAIFRNGDKVLLMRRAAE